MNGVGIFIDKWRPQSVNACRNGVYVVHVVEDGTVYSDNLQLVRSNNATTGLIHPARLRRQGHNLPTWYTGYKGAACFDIATGQRDVVSGIEEYIATGWRCATGSGVDILRNFNISRYRVYGDLTTLGRDPVDQSVICIAQGAEVTPRRRNTSDLNAVVILVREGLGIAGESGGNHGDIITDSAQVDVPVGVDLE